MMWEDRSYLYGDALFETVRVERGQVRWLELHLGRLEASGLALGYAPDTLALGLDELARVGGRADGLWRLTLTRGPQGVDFGGSGGQARWRWRPALGVPQRLHLMGLEGFYWPQDPLACHKTTSWVRHIEARRQAQLKGYDDALMLDPGGQWVGEASAANVFVRLGETWVTPPARGILPGVTRQGLIRAAGALGGALEVRPLSWAQVQREASEVCLVSAGIGVWPATQVQGRRVGGPGVTEMQRWLMHTPD